MSLVRMTPRQGSQGFLGGSWGMLGMGEGPRLGTAKSRCLKNSINEAWRAGLEGLPSSLGPGALLFPF